MPDMNIKQIHHKDLSFYLEIQQLKLSNKFFLHTDINAYQKNINLVIFLILILKKVILD